MDRSYGGGCCDSHSGWDVGSVVVVDGFAVDFVVDFVDCWGERVVGWNCYFDGCHIVGLVVDVSIVVVVSMVGDWSCNLGYCYGFGHYGYSFVGFHYYGYCHCEVGSVVYTVVGNCGSDYCRRGVDYWGDSCCYSEGVVENCYCLAIGW